MKNYYLVLLFLFSFCMGFAQTQDSLSLEEQQRREKNIQAGNPFKKFGYQPKISTLSKGKYLEFHDRDSIIQIGSFTFHVKRKEITGYIVKETKYSEATLRPEIVSRWFSPDPLAEEFPNWSPYNFVENNPIRMVDPTGLAPEDIIDIDIKNKKITITEAEGDDIVRIVNNDEEEKSYIYGSNGSFKAENTIEGRKTSNGTKYSYVKMNNDEKSTELFEFVAENSNVEWSQVKFGTKSSFVSTAFLPTPEPGGVDLMYGLLTKGYTVREHIHSHPKRKTNYFGPSGFHPKDKNSGDRKLGEWINDWYPNNGIRLKVYEASLKKYIEYNHKGKTE